MLCGYAHLLQTARTARPLKPAIRVRVHRGLRSSIVGPRYLVRTSFQLLCATPHLPRLPTEDHRHRCSIPRFLEATRISNTFNAVPPQLLFGIIPDTCYLSRQLRLEEALLHAMA
jgi:hypothetical protein